MGWKHRVQGLNDDGTLNCLECGVVDALYQFKNGKSHPVCSTARRKQRMSPGYKKHSHGLNPDQREQYLQDKCCEICGSSQDMVVDHCHESGAVRGSLCRNCNVGIGMLGDSPDRVASAAAYLARFK